MAGLAALFGYLKKLGSTRLVAAAVVPEVDELAVVVVGWLSLGLRCGGWGRCGEVERDVEAELAERERERRAFGELLLLLPEEQEDEEEADGEVEPRHVEAGLLEADRCKSTLSHLMNGLNMLCGFCGCCCCCCCLGAKS